MGGRWRIRAWKAPALATLEDNTLFLAYTEQRQLDLKVKAAGDYVVTSSMAPGTPFTGSQVQLAVLLLSQSVDDNGAVHRSPVGGAAVTLNIIGKWSLVAGDYTQATDYSGKATWTLTCTETGQQPMSVVVGGNDWPLSVPGCHDPMETTTTTTPPTTAPPPGASTTSSTKPKPKTTTTTGYQKPPSYATTSTRPAGGHY